MKTAFLFMTYTIIKDGKKFEGYESALIENFSLKDIGRTTANWMKSMTSEISEKHGSDKIIVTNIKCIH